MDAIRHRRKVFLQFGASDREAGVYVARLTEMLDLKSVFFGDF